MTKPLSKITAAAARPHSTIRRALFSLVSTVAGFGMRGAEATTAVDRGGSVANFSAVVARADGEASGLLPIGDAPGDALDDPLDDPLGDTDGAGTTAAAAGGVGEGGAGISLGELLTPIVGACGPAFTGPDSLAAMAPAGTAAASACSGVRPA